MKTKTPLKPSQEKQRTEAELSTLALPSTRSEDASAHLKK